MKIAILTDNDFEKVNGVTTTPKAVLRYPPDGMRLRIYTSAHNADTGPYYFAVLLRRQSFYGEMTMYWRRARCGCCARRAAIASTSST